MSTKRLERELIALMPRARRYARALTGDTFTADSSLAMATPNVVKQAPVLTFLTPTNMFLPWIFIELHSVLDSTDMLTEQKQTDPPDRFESTLYEQIDAGLNTLNKLQKRIYLMTALEQFSIAVTARVVGLPAPQTRVHFQQAHHLVSEHIQTHFVHNELFQTAS